jgi:hypothetical protein
VGTAEQQLRLPDKELGPSAGHEHACSDPHAKPAELSPTEDVFQGKPGDAPFNHRVQLGG